MRRGSTIAFCLCLMVASAAAESPRTNAAVTLRKKPGEKQAAVAQLKPGTPVVIESEAGRWLRVRVGSTVGYLTRTQLTLPPAAPASSGEWAAKAPQLDQVGTAPAAEVAAEAPPPVVATNVLHPAPIHADVALGYRSVGYDFSSNGSAGLANYLMSADAAALSLVLDGTRSFGRVVVGGDAASTASTATPGIAYMGSAGSGTIGFSTVSADGGVRAGTEAGIYQLALRAGMHYDAFLVHDVYNVGRLPRERLLGGTLGLRAQIAPATTRVAVALRFDALVVGNRRQTPGLEDGASSTARALWAGATVRIALARHLALLFAYDFGRASTHWTGMSVREPGVSNASRVDASQLIQIGVSAGL